jgi:hypothetical protein
MQFQQEHALDLSGYWGLEQLTLCGLHHLHQPRGEHSYLNPMKQGCRNLHSFAVINHQKLLPILIHYAHSNRLYYTYSLSLM